MPNVLGRTVYFTQCAGVQTNAPVVWALDPIHLGHRTPSRRRS